MKITNNCVLEHIKTLADNSINTIFSDPPYNLSSVWHFVTGRLCMKKGADFMGKWQGLDEVFLQTFFDEAFRTLKFGGYCCMFSIDRQAWVFQYFAAMAGFEVCQTLYWANISNFPKSSSADKMLDRSAGAEREVIGKQKMNIDNKKGNSLAPTKKYELQNGETVFNITSPATDLAKEFEGYKYGIAPLKKITEPLLIFRKAPKNGSVLADLLACKNDNEISPAVLDIENNRVKMDKLDRDLYLHKRESFKNLDGKIIGGITKFNTNPHNTDLTIKNSHNGRFPCTLVLTPASAELLDSQLDLINFELNGKLYQNVKRNEYKRLINLAVQNNELKSVKVLHVERENLHSGGSEGNRNEQISSNNFTLRKKNISTIGGVMPNTGGLSRVMHHADFTEDDYNSFENSQIPYELGVNEDTFYMPTVSPNERNLGCENLESINVNNASVGGSLKGITNSKEPKTNTHPTLKPIELIKTMSALFKLPNTIKQTVYVPFSGSGSEIIGLMLAGYDIENIIACEINPDYVEIAKHRIAYYQSLQPKEKIQTETKEITQSKNTLF